ncbi:MAG TPA: nucleoside-diphosphate kinase [Anaerolineae bacterium]|nr:nucleoside-diphosphate kinase [Anaerolineae bacterium]
MERTLVILKPDAVQRGLIGPITARLEQRGLKLVGMKFIRVMPDLAAKHYAVHQGKPFYDGLIKYITSSAVVVQVWEGKRAIQVVRNACGATNPAEAAAGTIRADFGVEIGRNLIHASDAPETALYEIPLYFTDSELVEWDRAIEPWITE